ncbi:MAG: acyltransferase domain-containing protein [Legionellales bacterium]|jgi:acyl transferase domain-containing protein|nr:acyltransferase domain-containing protein [Legionellales bacterium]
MINVPQVFLLRLNTNSFTSLQQQYTSLCNKISNGSIDNEFIDNLSCKSNDGKYSYAKVAPSLKDLIDLIVAEPPIKQEHTLKPKIAFLFTGQGSQLPFMGHDLYANQPYFKQEFNKCCAYLQKTLGTDIKSIIFSEDNTRLNKTGITQPALFAYEYALAKLWQHWGVMPTWVMGHSVGEYPAASFANYISCENGLKLISKRASLMQGLPPGGTMAAVLANYEKVAAHIENHNNVEVAAINGPMQTVISGNKDDITNCMQELKKNKIKSRELVVSHAFHSYLMEPMLTEFTSYARQISYSNPNTTLVSNVTGSSLAVSSMDAEYWCRHVREKVNFSSGLNSIKAAGANVYLEIGPQPFLVGMAERAAGKETSSNFLASKQKNKPELIQMLETAIELEQLGQKINWDLIVGLNDNCPTSVIARS